MPDPNNRLLDCSPGPNCLACESVFDRVVVSNLIRGRTRVMWELLETFTDKGPLEFQLQVGQTSSNDADDWEDVGLPVVDQYAAVDDEQRTWGNTNYTHYRVKLTTPLGEYLSLPTNGMGILDRRSWRNAREEARKALKNIQQGMAGQVGYLLKRRWTGQDCTVCLDHMTKEVRNPQCVACYGTGKLCGYYYPMACVWAEISPKTRHTDLDGGQSRGTVNDVVVSAKMLMTELMGEDDIWVSDKSDDRYYVHKIQHTLEIRGVPIIAQVELRPAPATSIVYAIEIPQQLIAHNVEDD